MHARTHTLLSLHLFIYSEALALPSAPFPHTQYPTHQQTLAALTSKSLQNPPTPLHVCFCHPDPAIIMASLDQNSHLCPHPARSVLPTLESGPAPPWLTASRAPTSLRVNVQVLPTAHEALHHLPHHLPAHVSSPPPCTHSASASGPYSQFLYHTRHLRTFAPAVPSVWTTLPPELHLAASPSHFSPPTLTLPTPLSIVLTFQHTLYFTVL